MKKILAINGSYRKNGVTDQTIEVFGMEANKADIQFEEVILRNYDIGFCTNCRSCTQTPGSKPGICVLDDGMAELITKLEEADAFLLASPTNFGSVTAIYKRFMERLVTYAYWPWDMNAPQYRKAGSERKKAVIISSCAAPGILGRLFCNTSKELKTTAKTIGADTVGSIFTGLIGKEQHPDVKGKINKKCVRLLQKLL